MFLSFSSNYKLLNNTKNWEEKPFDLHGKIKISHLQKGERDVIKCKTVVQFFTKLYSKYRYVILH